jgi:hypothetical protein
VRHGYRERIELLDAVLTEGLFAGHLQQQRLVGDANIRHRDPIRVAEIPKRLDTRLVGGEHGGAGINRGRGRDLERGASPFAQREQRAEADRTELRVAANQRVIDGRPIGNPLVVDGQGDAVSRGFGLDQGANLHDVERQVAEADLTRDAKMGGGTERVTHQRGRRECAKEQAATGRCGIHEAVSPRAPALTG